MSYTTLKGFNVRGEVFDIAEFRNSHYHGPVIWSKLWLKYCADDKTAPYAEFGYNYDLKRLWALQNDERLSDDEWYVLMCTFDHVVVPTDIVDTVCKAFEAFKPLSTNVVNHGHGYVEAIQKALEEDPSIIGFAWQSTSLTDEFWEDVRLPSVICSNCGEEVSEDDDDFCPNCEIEIENAYEPYNLNKHDKHWFLTKREDWPKK